MGGQATPLRYRPELDGVRACAVLLVFAAHAKIPYFDGGTYGVDVFFVLSGYLITQLLMVEWQDHGKLSLSKFYIRRGLRLYPALLGLLLCYLFLSPFLYPDYAPDAPRDVVVSGLYLSDYTLPFLGFPVVVAHTWSLSVEEHFYVLWPLALLLLLRRWPLQRCAHIMLGAFLALTLWRIVCIGIGQTWGEIYFRFDTRASGLALGCAYALWAQGRETSHRPFFPWFGAALILFSVFVATGVWQLSLTGGFTAVEVGTLLVIHGIGTQGLVNSMLSSAPMAYLGRISYGFYLWHYPIVSYLHSHDFGFAIACLGGGLLTLAAAAASHATIELWPRQLSARLKAGAPLPKWLRSRDDKSAEQQGLGL
jgi:peptidoglycan/LPS O-acetylase OafA/YrhL